MKLLLTLIFPAVLFAEDSRSIAVVEKAFSYSFGRAAEAKEKEHWIANLQVIQEKLDTDDSKVGFNSLNRVMAVVPESIVYRIYKNCLDKNPSAEERKKGIESLEKSKDGLAKEICFSKPALEHIVVSDFQMAVGRKPTDTELEEWTAKLRDEKAWNYNYETSLGASILAVDLKGKDTSGRYIYGPEMYSFTTDHSRIFIVKYLVEKTDEGKIFTACQTCLKRNPDKEDKARWEEYLRTNPKTSYQDLREVVCKTDEGIENTVKVALQMHLKTKTPSDEAIKYWVKYVRENMDTILKRELIHPADQIPGYQATNVQFRVTNIIRDTYQDREKKK